MALQRIVFYHYDQSVFSFLFLVDHVKGILRNYA